jgi:hypothetical protein
MKTMLRLTMPALLVSMFLTAYSLSPFSESAYAATGWIGCKTGNDPWAAGDPGNRSGCTVYYEGDYFDIYGIGTYRYVCNGIQTICLYKYSDVGDEDVVIY